MQAGPTKAIQNIMLHCYIASKTCHRINSPETALPAPSQPLFFAKIPQQLKRSPCNMRYKTSLYVAHFKRALNSGEAQDLLLFGNHLWISGESRVSFIVSGLYLAWNSNSSGTTIAVFAGLKALAQRV